MLHEILLAMLGHSGDLFEEESFELHPGFPDLHPAEKATLDKLALLGKRYKEILIYVETPTSFEFEAVLRKSLHIYLQNYRNEVLEVEKDILESDKISIYGILNKFEKVYID